MLHPGFVAVLLQPGDVLDIDNDRFHPLTGNKLVMSKQILLDDIAWILCTADDWGCSIEGQLRAELNEKYYEIYNQVYQKNDSRCSMTVQNHFQAWKLRGDNSEVYRLDAGAFQKRLHRIELQKFALMALALKKSKDEKRHLQMD